ncbi:hypothetical protein DMUE_2033 [Dictyocoela muelleri]|nr:hypothetical protein DMUE_2033 [Dictyocoela muelleri]
MISIAWDAVKKDSIINFFSKGLTSSTEISDHETGINSSEVVFDKIIDDVLDESIEDDAEEDMLEESTEEPRELIKKALEHFRLFYTLAEKFSSTKLKDLLTLKISLTKEWRKTYNFGRKITDYL